MYIIEISHVIAHYTSIYSKNKTFDSTQIFLIIIIYTFFFKVTIIIAILTYSYT